MLCGREQEYGIRTGRSATAALSLFAPAHAGSPIVRGFRRTPPCHRREASHPRRPCTVQSGLARGQPLEPRNKDRGFAVKWPPKTQIYSCIINSVIPLDGTRETGVPLTLAHERPTSMSLDHEVTLNSSTPGITLAGTLRTPKAPRAAALLLPGSGPLDRNESIGGQRPFEDLAAALSASGIASLRCDDRGVHKSTGDYLGIDAGTLLDDASAQLQFMINEMPSISHAVVGHSQGAIFATRLAARDQRVSKLILLGAAMRPGMDLMMAMRRLLADDSELTGETRSAYLEHSQALFETLVKFENDAQRAHAVRALIVESVKGASDADFNPDFETADAFIDFAVSDAMEWEVREILLSHAASELRHIDVPTLAIWGALDRHVDAEQERAVFCALGKARSRTVIIPGQNHLFQRTERGRIEDYSKAGPTMRHPVPKLITEWICPGLRLNSGVHRE